MQAKELTQNEIANFLSPYLSEGRKQESWQITQIAVDENTLSADICMTSTYVSATDKAGFHLTVFSTLEFLSQLMIIYAHLWAGLSKKTKEGWMVESSTRSVRAIRNPDAIHVKMHVNRMKKRGENLYCDASYDITDDQGGLFKVKLKGFLS